MKIVSVNTGLPREVVWHGKNVTTAIYKQPVEGRVALRKLNLDGDRQADLSVHGGEHKAVYCYPIEHYGYWAKELSGRALPMAIFGENFTTDGLLEDSCYVATSSQSVLPKWLSRNLASLATNWVSDFSPTARSRPTQSNRVRS